MVELPKGEAMAVGNFLFIFGRLACVHAHAMRFAWVRPSGGLSRTSSSSLDDRRRRRRRPLPVLGGAYFCWQRRRRCRRVPRAAQQPRRPPWLGPRGSRVHVTESARAAGRRPEAARRPWAAEPACSSAPEGRYRASLAVGPSAVGLWGRCSARSVCWPLLLHLCSVYVPTSSAV